jgi:hypothetical protein
VKTEEKFMTSVRVGQYEQVLRHVVMAAHNFVEGHSFGEQSPQPNQPPNSRFPHHLTKAAAHVEAAMMDPYAQGFLTHIGEQLDTPVEIRDITDFSTEWKTTTLRDELSLTHPSGMASLASTPKHEVATKAVNSLVDMVAGFIEKPFSFSVKPERLIPSNLSLLLGPIKSLLLTLVPPANPKP